MIRNLMRALVILCLLLILAWRTPQSNAPNNSSVESLAVSHLDVPVYPRIPLTAQVDGSIDVTVKINEEGKVVAADVSGTSPFQKEVETNVRTWTFSHLPAKATFPITHIVRYEFRLAGERADLCPQVTLDLPDGVHILAHPPIPNIEKGKVEP